jgi:hypothetical protein
MGFDIHVRKRQILFKKENEKVIYHIGSRSPGNSRDNSHGTGLA